ncbi:MAG: hypothetical protein KGL74_13015, partial [Elusimicrobia bacterium]|nr:hypothetical protein [Elusimicrobiota bacterium]
MKKNGTTTRWTASALSAALALSSFGPAAASAAAQEFVAGAAARTGGSPALVAAPSIGVSPLPTLPASAAAPLGVS